MIMEEMSFEKAMASLEKITAALEGGNLSLDESIKLYEQGVKLSDYCAKQLDAAEMKIKQLDKVGVPDEAKDE